MKLPRDLAGKHLASVLCRKWGYQEVHQAGSHVILETGDPSPQRISIPSHTTLRVGTLSSILKTVSRHKGVRRQDILDSL